MFGIISRKQLAILAIGITQLAVIKMDANIGSDHSTHGNASSGNQASTFEVEVFSNGFKTSFYVPSVFYGFIIGVKGATKTRIERETSTSIRIPRKGNGDIEIIGENQQNVRSAREQIEAIVQSSRKKLSVNHFNNVRITNDDIKSNYERLMKEILEGPPVDGLTEAMFMRPAKLHITINVMTLLDDNDVARATQLLYDCVERVIVPVKNQFGTVAMNVSGVGTFNDEDPATAKVVFGRIHSEPLQQIADGILGYFVAEGLSKYEYNETTVSMHMTVINARYDREQSDDAGNGTPRRRRNQPRKTIDATAILEKYANYDFGRQEVTEILLSSISEKDEDGFYKKIASVKF